MMIRTAFMGFVLYWIGSYSASAEMGVSWIDNETKLVETVLIGVQSRPVCSVRLTDIVAGEIALISGSVGLTNDTGDNVGVAAEIQQCESNDCTRIRGRAGFATATVGNITPDMHHATYPVTAMQEWRNADGLSAFRVMVRAYSSTMAGQRLTVDRCGISVLRFRP
jgi:hypothetical protein